MFTLNDNQRALLDTARAWREEGERRFDHWSRRAAMQSATDEFGALLAQSGLRSGRALPAETRDRLLRLASSLAPNTNLSKRLYSHNPADFDSRLRTLFYGDAPFPVRLRVFLAVRGTGAYTAAQLLCAFDPQAYPLITRSAVRRLRLTAAQKRDALADASAYYAFDTQSTPDAASLLLALFRVYETVRDALGADTYPEADDLLQADWPGWMAQETSRVVREMPAPYDQSPSLTETSLLAGIEEYALSQGFLFPPHLLRAYYIALKTKPFAILSGVSGTGKTRLAELFAECLTGRNMAQFRLIPVRPDWADSAPLLGYQNVIANRYVSTPFLEMARTAGRPENAARAYFVCLDEMNLARVEHYLADYLSALESRGHRIPLHEDIPDLILPPNLFVTGTVNMDETTHLFSRKVLDRANTLDFDAAPRLLEITSAAKGQTPAIDAKQTPAECQRLFLRSRITSAARARERLSQFAPEFPGRALRALQQANDLLYPHRLHFAYRVRDDVLCFLANSFEAETAQGLLTPDLRENFALALDLQFCQKVLPKLNGLAEHLDPLLSDLLRWADNWPLPRTAEHLARMRAQGAQTGYIRFYE